MMLQQASQSAALIALAVAGGALAAWAGVPLAWLVGAMLVTALASLSGEVIAVPPLAYRAGQITIAVAVGLTVSADVAARIVPHLPLIVIGALASVAIGRLLSPALVVWGGMSAASAHFAIVPAGISEMSDHAGRRGADVGAVATFHTLRVMMVVLILPLALVFGTANTGLAAPAAVMAPITTALLVALLIGLGSGVLANKIGMASGFFVAPMLVLSLLSGAGWVQAAMPPVMLAVAQIALGMALGGRFRRATVQRLPRALAVGVPVLVIHAALMALIALLAAHLTGFDPLLLVLGLATGGTAEMVLTAKMIGTDAALVAAYQVTRGLAGNLLADPIYRYTLMKRVGQ